MMAGKVYLSNLTQEIRRPSIIPQKKKKSAEREEIVDSLLQQEIDQDLSTDFLIRNGMLVAAPQMQPTTSNLQPGPSSSTRRVVVVNSGDPNSYLRPRPLPGTADEIESYPCRICNRVFLTDNGLLKHAEREHPLQIRLINDDIQFITAEWKRRELHLAVKKNIKLPILKTRKSTAPKSPGVYEWCHICDTMIKLDTKDAFEIHKQKHLNESEIIIGNSSDLHCGLCALTFISHETYLKHIASHRKRTFVCRYCGSKFPSVIELKRHKLEYHEYRPNNLQNSHKITQRINVASLKRSFNAQSKYPEKSNVRASCDKCGLSFHKVDLLIRHIFTAHQINVFTAKISVKGMPVYSISVNDKIINYECCNILFEDKVSFCAHRQSSHTPFLPI